MSPVTTESSQPAQPAPEAPQGAPEATPSSGNQNQQLRIAILVVIGALVALGLFLYFRNNDSKKHNAKGTSGPKVHLVKGIGPVLQNETQLATRPLTLAQPIYWAGAKKGYKYEFWRLRNRRIFVRYLPNGTPAGANGKKYLIVATYPFPDAYNRLKKLSKSKGTTKNGAYIWVRPGSDGKSILMAWPQVPYEVEVYDHNPQKAASVAESGDVGPVAG
jgi:hypothetical protein